jgi:hypothetical protein
MAAMREREAIRVCRTEPGAGGDRGILVPKTARRGPQRLECLRPRASTDAGLHTLRDDGLMDLVYCDLPIVALHKVTLDGQDAIVAIDEIALRPIWRSAIGSAFGCPSSKTTDWPIVVGIRWHGYIQAVPSCRPPIGTSRHPRRSAPRSQSSQAAVGDGPTQSRHFGRCCRRSASPRR